MWGLGFGLERIGLLAVRKPIVFSVVIAIMSAVCLAVLPGVKFDGNVVSVLPDDTDTFKTYQEHKRNFRNFSRDIAVIVESDRLISAEGLEEVRNLQLELSLTDGVGSAVSVLSVPNPDPQTGNFKPFFPDTITDDAEAVRLIEELQAIHPQVSSLISREHSAALIFVTLDIDAAPDEDRKAYRALQNLKKTVAATIADDFTVHYAGLTPIGLTILETLVSDQVRLTLIGLVLGAAIAMIVFRSVVAAFICAIPPALTAIWSIGLFAIAGIPINYLTTVLPTLALVLAYADGIMLFYRWYKTNSEAEDGTKPTLVAGIVDAVRRVGPASSLTSVTTAIAFFSFSISSSAALTEFAWLGVAIVALAFLSVIIGLPVAGYWAVQLGLVKRKKPRRERRTLGSWASFLSMRYFRVIAIGTLIVIAGLGYIHANLKAEYRVTDYLPRESATFEAERLTNKVFGGRSFVFITVPVVEGETYASPASRKRLQEVETVLADNFGADHLFSLNSLWRQFSSQAAVEKVARQLDQASPTVKQSYVSRDGEQMLVSLRIASDQSISETLEQIAKIRGSLESLSLDDSVRVTGFPVLMAEEFTRLIGQLRTSLLIAICLGVIIMGIASRSFMVAICAATPNLFPILAIEAVLYFRSGVINMSEVIALTLAFGIAIDNAVHVVNVFLSERRSGKGTGVSIRDALYEVGPALGASTLIICTSCLVTLTSILPMIPILGQLIIAILFIALFSNLAILPANILTITRTLTPRR